ncbi:hypothetical protein GCM10009000_020870 [Halobacterium noricense]
MVCTLAGCATTPTENGSSDELTDTQSPTTSEQKTGGTVQSPHSRVTDATRKEGGSREWEVPLEVKSTKGPFVTFRVGDREDLPSEIRPHYVVVENQQNSGRQIALRVQDEKASQPAIDTELQFPSQGIAQIGIMAPSAYETSITVSDETTGLTVPQSAFDCNDSATGVYVQPDEGVEHSFVSTAMGCSTETEY